MIQLQLRNKTLFNHLEENIDALVITNGIDPYIDPNFFYVTGLYQGLYEHCTAVIYPDGTGQLLVSTLEEESASESHLNLLSYQTKDEYQTMLVKLLSSAQKIGFNSQGLLHHDYLQLTKLFPNISFVDAATAFSQARMKKDNTEIQTIQKACDIAVATAKEIPSMIQPGITENELAASINHLLQQHGADAPAFETIASFGAHTAQPHYTHAETSLQKGDFILCDFGARYHHYHSDMTRTFVYGAASEKQKRMHATVQHAQQQAFQHLRPGIITSDIHQLTKTVIDHSEFSGRFIHSTGHSLGLCVHDGGVGFQETSTVPLEKNMVLTVEPGIYLPGYGGVRIEDDILITDKGYRLLTDVNRDLIEL
ncbi:MAG: Xaa-Pro peptidase family protein [Thermoplasmatota archaeon]